MPLHKQASQGEDLCCMTCIKDTEEAVVDKYCTEQYRICGHKDYEDQQIKCTAIGSTHIMLIVTV